MTQFTQQPCLLWGLEQMEFLFSSFGSMKAINILKIDKNDLTSKHNTYLKIWAPTICNKLLKNAQLTYINH